MKYKECLLENLYNHAPAERYVVYEGMEDEMRSMILKEVSRDMTEVDRNNLIHEYQEYYLKKYVPVRADTKERFYVSQLVRCIVAHIKQEFTQ